MIKDALFFVGFFTWSPWTGLYKYFFGNEHKGLYDGLVAAWNFALIILQFCLLAGILVGTYLGNFLFS